MLLRQTLLYLPAQVLSPLLQFVAILAWAWWLTPEDMGVFTLLTATQELGYLLFLSWFSAYALRFFDEGGENDRAGYQAAEIIVIAGAAVFNFALALTTLTLVTNTPPSMEMIFAAGAFMALRSVNIHLAERARAGQAIVAYTLLQVTGPALGLTFGFFARFFLHLDAHIALFVYALAHGLAIALSIPMIGMRLARPRLAGPTLRAALVYGLPLVVAGGVSWVALNSVRYVAEFWQGTAAVGLIAVGLGLGQRGTSFAAMFVTAAAFPLAVKARREGGRGSGMRQLADGGALLVAALLPASVGLCAISSDVANLLVSEAYREATLAVLPLAVLAGAARNLRTHFPDQVFLLDNRPGILTLVDSVDALATTVFAIAGIVLMGITGAMLGAAVGAIVTALMSFALATRQKGFVFPWGHAARALLASLVMFAALALTGPVASIAMLIAKIVLGAAVYALALAALYPDMALTALARLRRRAAH